jgi:hypothetical protein
VSNPDVREYSLPDENARDPRDNIQPFSMEEDHSRDDSPMLAHEEQRKNEIAAGAES